MRFKNYLKEDFTYKTQKDETGHIHSLKVNDDGDGKTTSIEGKSPDHIHKIFQWMVQPANGHIHNIDLD